MDSKPRELGPGQLLELQSLAAQLVAMMEKRAEFMTLFDESKGAADKA